MEENKEYKLKEVRDLTGLSNDLIRLYEKEFNLNFERSDGGHRRFTEKDVQILITIKKKVQEQNWSYKQVRSWLNGDIDPLIEHQDQEFVSNLEKEFQDLKQEFKEKSQRDEDFQRTLIQKLEEQQKFYQEQLEQQKIYYENKILESHNDVVKQLKPAADENKNKNENKFLKFFRFK